MPNLIDPDKVVVKDSGQREKMPTGSQRDSREGKGRFDLLPWPVLRRDALLYENGARKYNERNWEKGQRTSRYFDSAIRHLQQYMCGDREEDHLAAARFNIAGMMFNEEMIKLGKLPLDLYDIPDYTPVVPTGGPEYVITTETWGVQEAVNLLLSLGYELNPPPVGDQV